MDLSVDLILNHKLTKLGVNGTYPQTDNCYKVEVLHVHTKVKYIDEYVPKPVFEMWVTLKNLKKKAGRDLSKAILKELIKNFIDFGEWNYSEADYNASMNENEDI